MFWAIYGVVLFAAFAMMVREGLWSNTISLFNIIISGLIAFGFYAPLATWLDKKLNGQFTYILDFVVVWVLFIVAILVCRTVNKAASKTRLRFKHPIDPVGGPLVGFFAAWVLTAFTTATLFMAPMPKDAFGGRLTGAIEKLNSGSTDAYSQGRALTEWPDLTWLRFVERVSSAQSLGSSSDRIFRVRAYLETHRIHREALESSGADWLRVKR